MKKERQRKRRSDKRAKTGTPHKRPNPVDRYGLPSAIVGQGWGHACQRRCSYRYLWVFSPGLPLQWIDSNADYVSKVTRDFHFHSDTRQDYTHKPSQGLLQTAECDADAMNTNTCRPTTPALYAYT